MSVELEKVCKKNLNRAILLQNSIFPKENGTINTCTCQTMTN